MNDSVKHTILLVEDEIAHCELIIEAFEDANINPNIIVADSVIQALKFLNKEISKIQEVENYKFLPLENIEKQCITENMFSKNAVMLANIIVNIILYVNIIININMIIIVSKKCECIQASCSGALFISDSKYQSIL